MKQVRSSRQVPPQTTESWPCQEEATIDHLVRLVTASNSRFGSIHSAFTTTGLAIEDQVRKSWRPQSRGLAMF